MHYYHFFSTWF